MMEWDSRMQNNHSVQILKTAIPFFDIGIGEKIDIEGLLRAIRPFASERERNLFDMILNFFQMKNMMAMMQMFQAMQNEAKESGSDMFQLLKQTLPPKEQETMDMAVAMMSMMSATGESSPDEQADVGKEGTDEFIHI